MNNKTFKNPTNLKAKKYMFPCTHILNMPNI